MKLVIFISLSSVFLESLIVHCTNVEHPVSDKKSKRSEPWNDEDKTKLLKIFYETNPGKRNHANRIKDRWDELNPNKRITLGHSLYTRLTDWIVKGEADRLLTEKDRLFKEYEPRLKKTKWTPEMKKNVLKFYRQTNTKERGHSNRMKVLWDKEYPDHPDVTAHHLMVRARDVLKKEKKVSHTDRQSLTTEEKEDLLRCYHLAWKDTKERMKMARDLFIKRNPQHANISHSDLRVQLFKFKDRHPEINEKILREFLTPKRVNVSWLPERALGTWEAGSTSMPTIQNHDSQGIIAHHSPSNHTRELEELSGPQQKESTSTPTFQSHHPPEVSGQYSDTNHSKSPGGTSASKQKRSTSISTLQIDDIPRVSEQYFDPNRDNAWIDHMIRDSSFFSAANYLDEGTSHQNIYHSNIWDRPEWESYQHHPDRGQSNFSKGKQPAPR